MTPDNIALRLMDQLDRLSAAYRDGDRYAHGSPIPAPSREVAERAARCAYELAREIRPDGLPRDRRYSFNVEREGGGWQVVVVIVVAP